MDKIVRYVPLALFTASALKVLVVSASWIDAVALLILGGLSAFVMREHKGSEIKAFEQELKALRVEHAEITKKMEEFRTHLTGLKLTTPMRSNVGR
jgi:hypothetical protein